MLTLELRSKMKRPTTSELQTICTYIFIASSVVLMVYPIVPDEYAKPVLFTGVFGMIVFISIPLIDTFILPMFED